MEKLIIIGKVIEPFDNNCKFCQEAITKLQEKIDKAFMNSDIKEIHLSLNPDRNSAGILTHFHIDVIE